MEEKVKELIAEEIILSPALKEVIYRTGQAPVIKEPKPISITGDIQSVSDFLLKRYTKKSTLQNENPEILKGKGNQEVDFEKAIVLVDKDGGTLQLLIDPENFYGATITGKLEESKELAIFNVNEDYFFSREQLIKLIRLNRIHFTDKDKHAALLAAFQKFSAKVYLEIEKENDNRGNASALFKQTVNSQVPLNFKLTIPIYKGQPEETFTVDINIETNGNAVNFYFESIELAELLEQRKNEIFMNELKYCVDFPIIHK